MSDNDNGRAEVERLQAQIVALEQLLEVHERTVLEQSERLYQEQARLSLQKTLLECQSEASVDGLLGVSHEGKILSFNRRLLEMWGIPQKAIDTQAADAILETIQQRLLDPRDVMIRLARLSEHSDEKTHDEVLLKDGRTIEYYSAPIQSDAGVR
jgi:PAS domain-containing protein